jgi:hypothetical protein
MAALIMGGSIAGLPAPKRVGPSFQVGAAYLQVTQEKAVNGVSVALNLNEPVRLDNLASERAEAGELLVCHCPSTRASSSGLAAMASMNRENCCQ